MEKTICDDGTDFTVTCFVKGVAAGAAAGCEKRQASGACRYMKRKPPCFRMAVFVRAKLGRIGETYRGDPCGRPQSCPHVILSGAQRSRRIRIPFGAENGFFDFTAYGGFAQNDKASVRPILQQIPQFEVVVVSNGSDQAGKLQGSGGEICDFVLSGINFQLGK